MQSTTNFFTDLYDSGLIEIDLKTKIHISAKSNLSVRFINFQKHNSETVFNYNRQ